jgi:hypothetical protein
MEAEEIGGQEATRSSVEHRFVDRSKNMDNGKNFDNEGKVFTPSIKGVETKVQTPQAPEPVIPESSEEKELNYVTGIVSKVSTDLLNKYNDLNLSKDGIQKLGLRGQESYIDYLIRQHRKTIIESINYQQYDGEIDIENDMIKMYKKSVLSNKLLFVYSAWSKYGQLFDNDMFYVVKEKDRTLLIGSVGLKGSVSDVNYYVVYVDKEK